MPKKSWFTVRALAGAAAEVLIYDEIGAYGVSAKAFLDELAAIPEASAITLRINSPGGSVFDAVAIFNALKRRTGTVTVHIDGIAASAASYVAMAGDEIVMPENAFLMIHDPSGMVMGSAADMRAMAEALEKIRDSLVSGYADKSGASSETVVALMAKETWLSAEEALTLGFCDRVEEPVRIAAHFDLKLFHNAPSAAAAMLNAASETVEVERGGEVIDPALAIDGQLGPDAPVTGAAPEAPDDVVTQPEPPTGPAEPGNVDSAVIRAEALAYAGAVLDLCRLAGLPDMASQFLSEPLTIDQVRAALLERKAEAGPEVASHHPQPGRGAQAKPWAQVIARTFRL